LLLLTLLAAILGGAILNLMPCVFPVISIKALSLFKHHDQRKTLRREALFFSAGVILSFAALGAALAALRAGGAELGWGFQLQSPRMVLFLILLFFAMALNLSGVYEFGMFAQGAMSKTKNNATAFLSGVLAVAVASPCTAPFMGAALGFALTQPLAATLSIFIALGVGMALPYSLLAFFPMWAKYLPRPGVWMDDLKKILAFPLYATVAWLMWVLISQTNSGVALGAMFALCALALALWANQRRRAANMMSYRTAYAWLVLAIAALAAAVYFVAPAARFSASAQKTSASLVWQNYDPARIQELNAEGKTVFADFTAAWCVTCQINEKLALDDAAVQSAFEKHRIVLMRADWTNRDAQIEQTLARLGRNGVPVYVFYRPGKPPELLPELLRAQTVIDAIERTTETLNAKR
jgi:thiol:disulfide interchange protein DsbD